jgi:hypothetical protein
VALDLYSEEEFASRFKESLAQVAHQGFKMKFQGGAGDEPTLSQLRMSSIGDCARRQYYGLTIPQVREPPENPWQNILGYAGQEIVTATLKAMGYTLFGAERTVNYGGITGHIDGLLTGLDLGTSVAVWDSKLRNSFALYRWIKDGVDKDPRTYYQLQSYVAATNAECAIITGHAFDLTDTRARFRQYKVEGRDPQSVRFVLEPNREVIESIPERVQMIRMAVDIGVVPDAEYEPIKNEFPCTFCPFIDRCLLEGSSDFVVTPLVR